MKYYRLNQIAMAVLVALLLFFGTKTLMEIVQKEPEHEKPGYDVAGTEAPKEGEAKPGAPQVATLLAGADVGRGTETSKKCAICHTFDKGGANLIGPNLYGVLGRKVASHEGYEYSEALKAKGGNWDYAMLDHMIENPNAFAPGTKMALFPGLPDAKQRADVIVFLRSKNDSPPPLPEPSEAAAPAEKKPADEAPAAGGSEIVALIASADPAKGEADAALCKVCHTFDKGGPVLVGPNLYDIVGKKIAAQEGVNYTPALKAKGGEWTYEHLDAWLTNPQAFAAGTTMAFPGLPDAKKRADVIAFLRSKSDSPAPLPEAAPAEAAPPAEKPASEAPAPEAPASETPAPEAPPAAAPETPPAPEAAPPAETPAAPEAAPSAETAPAAPEGAPAAEPEAPAQEQPAPEAPAAEPAAPPAETPPAATDTAPPADAPPAPTDAAPQAETPPAAMDAAPATETAPAEEAEPAPAEPSMGEPPSPSQPQPVYPEGPPEGVQ
jgi:cytochrome c